MTGITRIKNRLTLVATVAAIMTAGNAHAQNNNTSVEPDSFVRTASTVFAPLYGPLAGHIVGTFGCAGWEGVGIDIGGGPGNLAVELAKLTPSMKWINLDINPAFFTHVADLAGKEGVGDRIGSIAADVHAMPFRDAYADIVVSRGSLHMWRDRPSAFVEILRVMKPGGLAWIGRGLPPNLPVETARTLRTRQGGGPEYDKEATARELERIMKSLGVSQYTIHMPSPPGADDVNYGVWLEFRKPWGRGATRASRPQSSSSTASPVRAGEVYVFEPVEITGTKQRDIIAEPLTESAGLELTTTVVERAEMEKQGAKTVIDALEYVPGAWVETRGRKVKQFFSVRGQKYPYPEYSVDGALFREFHEIPYFFSSADIERIEVLRSSASMLSGISGITGVVNIVPRTYTKPETSWEVEYGSFESYRAHLAHGGKAGNISYSLGVDTPHTDGPDGRNAAERMSNFNSSVRWDISPKLTVRTSLFHIDGKRQLTLAKPPATDALQNDLSGFDPTRTTFATLRTQYRAGGDTSTDVLVYYADRDNHYTSITGTGVSSVREWDFEWGMNAVQSYGLTPNNTMRAGVYYNRWVAPNGARFYVGRKCDLETMSAAVVDEHRIGALTLDAGLRLSRTYIHEYGGFNINGTARGFGKVEPITDEWEPFRLDASLGASYYINPALSLHANAVAGTVKPREGTLDNDGGKPGDERRVKLDAGVRATANRIGEAAVSLFLNEQNNAIVLSGLTRTVDGRTMELYLNRDQRQYGVEVDLKSRKIREAARVFLNVTAMDPRAEADGNMKRDNEMPRFISSAGVYGNRGKWDANIFWKYMSGYESLRFAAVTDPVPLGEFHTLNLSAGRSFGGTLGTRIYAEVRNLTDEEYSTVVGYPDFGRRYTVGIRQVFR